MSRPGRGVNRGKNRLHQETIKVKRPGQNHQRLKGSFEKSRKSPGMVEATKEGGRGAFQLT